MSAWIPALHAGMTELRGPCVHLSETPLVNDAMFSKEPMIRLILICMSLTGALVSQAPAPTGVGKPIPSLSGLVILLINGADWSAGFRRTSLRLGRAG